MFRVTSGQRSGHIKRLAVSLTFGIPLVLAGCADQEGGADQLSFLTPQAITQSGDANTAEVPLLPAAKEHKTAKADQSSAVIDALMSRTSVVSADSAEAQVTEAVLAADASPTGNELRAAVLRSKARDKNWLPNIDPRVSLASLSGLAASVLTDLVLFDNGGKKAERQYARADIDVASVALVEARNKRIAEALSLQNAQAEAEAKHKISDEALSRLREYRRVLAGRVGGGIDNPADLAELDRTISSFEADMQAEARAAQAAKDQLGVMTENALPQIPPPKGLNVSLHTGDPLPVLAAIAEAERAEAEAGLARASLSPTLSAGSTGIGPGNMKGRVNAGGSVMIFGRKDEIQSINARAQAAKDRVDVIREETHRQLVRAQNDAQSALQSAAEADQTAAHLAENHRMFDAQFKGGQRPLLDAANVYVSMMSQRKDAVGYRTRSRQNRIDLARDQGLLIDGGRI